MSPVPGPSSLLAVLERVGARGRSLHVRRASCRGGRRPARRRSGASPSGATRSSCTRRRAASAACSPTSPRCARNGSCASGARSRRCSRSSGAARAAELAAEIARRRRRARRVHDRRRAARPVAAIASDDADAGADEQLDRLVRALLDARRDAEDDRQGAGASCPGVSHKEAYARVLAIAERAMTLTRVVGKGRTAPCRRPSSTRCAPRTRTCAVDVGTGDARFAYHLASEHPDWLVIGLDALDEPMGEIAYKATRKPTRGGRPNLVLLRARSRRCPRSSRRSPTRSTCCCRGARCSKASCARHRSRRRASRRSPAGCARAGHAQRRDLARLDAGALRGPPGSDAGVRRRGDRAGVPAGRHRSRAGALPDRSGGKALPTTWARRSGHGRAHPQVRAHRRRAPKSVTRDTTTKRRAPSLRC